MKNKLIFMLVGMILLIGMANANVDQSSITIKQSQPITIVQTCANSTYSTINSAFIDGLNTPLINSSTSMTLQSTDTYIYVFTNTTTTGTYYFYGFCDENGVKTNFGLSYVVSATGQDLTSAKATSYTLIFIIGFILWLGILLLAIYLPSGNQKDEMTGYILYVSNAKYLKYFLFELSGVLITVIAHFSWMYCYSYLDFNFLTGLCSAWFYTMMALTIVGFPLVMYFTISNLIKDSQVADYLMRGLHVQ